MRLLEKICKELGVEVGEEWLGSNGYYYTITKESDIKVRDPEDKEASGESLVYWDDILTDKVKPVWKPKKGETYYSPYINALYHSEVYVPETWGEDRQHDQVMWDRCMVFKTKQEAINCANEMIMLAKQGI